MAKNKLQEIVMAFAMNKSNKSPKRYSNISDTSELNPIFFNSSISIILISVFILQKLTTHKQAV